MKNKIVLELIKKELDELRILVDTLQQKEDLEQLLIDITTSKARILLQELTLLNGKKEKEQNKTTVPTDIKINQNEIDALPSSENLENKSNDCSSDDAEIIKENPTATPLEQAPSINKFHEEPDIKVELPIEHPLLMKEEEPAIDQKTIEKIKKEAGKTEKERTTSVDTISTTTIKPKVVPIEVKEITIPTKPIIVKEGIKIEKVEKLVKVEEELDNVKEGEEKKILGEQFTKERSLNEQLASRKSPQINIKGKPITSLKKAIGLNDKYLFTRELFENNTSNFVSAIDALDNATSLIEAVEHLEQNFKWQKNETSLKFMDLVKRRFEDQNKK